MSLSVPPTAPNPDLFRPGLTQHFSLPRLRASQARVLLPPDPAQDPSPALT